MKLGYSLLLTCTFIVHIALAISKSEKPNIILIVADDMGIDDVSIHGSDQISTPNIDAILSYGINLNQYYSAPMCTPARSALMTGNYPSSVGMQHYVIANFEPWGLSLHDKVMPEYMKEAGYDTHLVGKWHLGHYEERRTPVHRGFDTFFGCYAGYIDYYNHSADAVNAPFPCDNGFDIRNNVTLSLDTLGQYSTNLFADIAMDKIRKHDQTNPLFLYLAYTAPHAGNPGDPLQVPEEYVHRFRHIADPDRRRYAGMVSVLDDTIGQVVETIKEAGMLENSVIIFVSDNGAPVQQLFNNSGSNYPFRGQKNSPWEGAVHVTGGIWSPLLESKQRTSNELMHISDWLPTLAHVAGFKLDKPGDGMDMWTSLSQNTRGPRTEMLINVDNQVPYSAYRYNQWKYINGTTANGLFDGWLSEDIDRTERDTTQAGYGQLVIDSPVGRALAPFSRSKINSSISLPGNPMSAAEINELRKKSQFTCNGVPLQTNAKWQCNPLQGPCLFDMVADPCERRNVISQYPLVTKIIEKRVQHYIASAKAPRNAQPDPCSNPKYFNRAWVSYYDQPAGPGCVRNPESL